MSNSAIEATTCLSLSQAGGGGFDRPRQVTPGRARRLGLSESRRPAPLGFIICDVAIGLELQGLPGPEALQEAERRVHAWASRWPTHAARAAR